MKLLYAFALALLPLLSFGQTLPKVDNQYAFVEVVPVDLSQQEIQKRARAWFAQEFKSAKDVIQLDSEEAIIGNGMAPLSHGAKLHFTLSLQFKDGRYRWEFSNLAYSVGAAKSTADELLSSPNSYNRKGELKALPKLMVEETSATAARLQDSFNKALQASNSDW